MLTALIVIAIAVTVFLFIVSRIRRGMMRHDAFFTQVKFIQMYMSDNTQKQFYNQEVEDAVALGQKMLWEASEEFHERMHKAVIGGEPIPMGDMGIIIASIKIIKAAEAMVFISNNGPVYEDEDDDRDHTDEAAPPSLSSNDT